MEFLPSLASQFAAGPCGSLIIRCGTCLDQEATAKASARHAGAVAANRGLWDSICPQEFRTMEEGGETDRGAVRCGRYQDPDGLPISYTGLMSLRQSVLYLYGEPGTRKTRIAWRMARQAFDGHGPQWGHLFTAWSFQTASSDAAGAFQSGQWMRDLVAAPLIIIDDLGKCDWTGTAAAAFFELIDQRTAHHRQTVITANMTGNQCKEWMSTGKSALLAACMEPIARRIREHGVMVTCLKGTNA